MSLLMSVLNKRQKNPTLHTYNFTALTPKTDVFHGRNERFYPAADDPFGEASYRNDNYSVSGARFAKYNNYYYSALLLFKETSQQAEQDLEHILSLDSEQIQSVTLHLDFSDTGSYTGDIYWDTAASGEVPTSSSDYFTSVHKKDGLKSEPFERHATSIDIDVTEYGIPSSCGWLVHNSLSTNIFLNGSTLTVNTMEV